MSNIAATPGADHTFDPSKLVGGQVAFLYGYIPVVVWGQADNGEVEVSHFGSVEYVEATDLATARGPLPTSALPTPPTPGDRIAQLEAQVQALLDLVKGQQAATAVAPAEPTEPAASAATTEAAAPAAVLPFGVAPTTSDDTASA